MCTGNKRMERERGVALIFTLAMLGLLMMLLLLAVDQCSRGLLVPVRRT